MSQYYRLVQGQTRNRLYDATRLLRLERNATGLRDFSEIWARRLLDAPEDAGHWALGCRAAMLRTVALSLVTLPEPVSFDKGLALRAAEEAAAFGPQSHSAWATLAIVLAQLDRFDAARDALQNAEQRPAGKVGDGFLRFGESLTRLGLGDGAGARIAFDRAVAAEAEADRLANPDDLHPVVLRDIRRAVSRRLGLAPAAAQEDPVSSCGPTE